MGNYILYDFEVKHPDYPTVTVSSIGADSATMQAAKEKWGLNGKDWAAIVGDMTVRRMGRTLKLRCRRCGREMEMGAASAFCADCQKAEDYYRREKAQVRTADRRPGYRGD